MASPSYALVTGASSGLGSAFARALPPERPLLLTGRDAGRLAALAAELGQGGRPVETLAADLADAGGRAAVVEAARSRPLGLLINNAGLGALGRFAESDAARQAEMVLVNCLAPVVLARALLPALLEEARRSGHRAGLIQVASIAAATPLPFFAVYGASKAFDRHFGEALAMELRREPVDVLTLSPGTTATAFFARAEARGMERGAMAPDAVAAAALAALGRRTHLVPGLRNRLYVAAIGLVPPPLRRRAVTAAMRRFRQRSR